MRPFFGNRSGVSAVEFALLAPIFVAILAGTADFGIALRAKLNLNSAVSAGANYALLNADDVTPASAADLAANIAKILAADAGNGTIAVNINNTAMLSVTESKSQAAKGGDADSCYCPTGSGITMNWGSPVSCGAPCPDGSFAGKFVSLSVSEPFSPLFGGYGMVSNGQITAQAIAQVQ
jgi:Flp pilus assembly protein TadG